MSVSITEPLIVTVASDVGSGTIKDGSITTGILNAVALEYTGVDVGSVVTITDTLAGVTRTLLSVTGNTDGFFSPMQPIHENGDGSVVTDQWTPAVLFGSQITVTVASGGDGTVTVSLVVLQ